MVKKIVQPSPPLAALFGLKLKHPDLVASFVQELDALSAQFDSEHEEQQWGIFHERAIELVTKIIANMDSTLEALQLEELELQDPAELKREFESQARRDADRKANAACKALEEIGRDWKDRTGRQFEQIVEDVIRAGKKELTLQEEITDDGIRLGVDEVWWPRFTGYVLRCAEIWVEDATTNAEADLVTMLNEHQEGLTEFVDVPFYDPDPSYIQPEDLRIPTDGLPTDRIEIPSLFQALSRFVLSNVMRVGMFGFALALGGTFAAQYFGMLARGTRINTMFIRAGVVLAVLPPSIIFGFVIARKERARLRTRAIEKQTEKLERALVDEVKRAVTRQKQALERHHTLRAQMYVEHIAQWRLGPLERAINDRAKANMGQVHELKLHSKRLREKQSKVRSLRNRLHDNLLFDLKKYRAQLP